MAARLSIPTAALKTPWRILTIGRLTPGDLANIQEPETLYELLSDEDMENIFQFKEDTKNENCFIRKASRRKKTRSLPPWEKKSRSAFAVYAALVLMLCCCTTTAFAARATR